METIKKSTEGQVAGIIGVVLGVISLIVAFIPCVGVVAFIPGGLALIFSIISIVQANRGDGSKALGIASFIVSCIAIIIAVVWLMVFSGVSIITKKAIDNPDLIEQIGRDIKVAIEDIDDSEPSKARIDTLENVLRNLEDEKKQKKETDDSE